MLTVLYPLRTGGPEYALRTGCPDYPLPWPHTHTPYNAATYIHSLLRPTMAYSGCGTVLAPLGPTTPDGRHTPLGSHCLPARRPMPTHTSEPLTRIPESSVSGRGAHADVSCLRRWLVCCRHCAGLSSCPLGGGGAGGGEEVRGGAMPASALVQHHRRAQWA